MNVIPIILFGLAAAAAVLAIRGAIRSHFPAYAGIRVQLRQTSLESEIAYATVQTRGEDLDPQPQEDFAQRLRRRARPKPVTHRLHHFRGRMRAA